MGIMSWDLEGGFNTAPFVRTPRLTIRCEYPDTGMASTEVTFEEFEVEADWVGEEPFSFWSETVRRVVVE